MRYEKLIDARTDYGFPCNTVPTVTFTLGGSPYSMAPTDFNLGNLGADQCLGAVFAIDTSSGSPGESAAHS